MSSWEDVLFIAAAGILLVPWLYVAARVVTRGILRTLREWR